MKNKRNDGRKFEEEVEKLYRIISSQQGDSIVERDVMLESPEGERQIDVLITSNIAGHEIKNIIECKDYLRKVDLPKVDAFHSIIQDVRANKGIIVSRIGFSKNAVQKAHRLGISLCKADHLSKQLDNPLSSLPIVIKFITVENISLEVTLAKNSEGTKIRLTLDRFICGMDLKGLLSNFSTSDLFKYNTLSKSITHRTLNQPLWMDGEDGSAVPISECELKIKISPEVYFAFASNLPSAYLKQTIGENHSDIIMATDDLDPSKNHLVRYRKYSTLPENILRSHIKVLGVPKSYQSMDVSVEAIDQDSGRRLRLGSGTLTSNT